MKYETPAEWLAKKPFTLSLSSGFFGFYAHAGVVTALEELKLIPEKLTGASAGALIAALWASGLSAFEIAKRLFALKRKDFWDPWPGLGLLRGKQFDLLLRENLPVKTFEQCQRPVKISAFNLIKRKTDHINKGDIPTAVRASCAYPILFHPVKIDNHYYIDGGIGDGHGLADTKPGERVFYHHLFSSNRFFRRINPYERPPQWQNMITLTIKNLPRVHPYRLDDGKKAFDFAYQVCKQKLSEPINSMSTF